MTAPIHKRGDQDRCENYRGRALGNAAYKILLNIILGKIKPYIEKVMGDNQNEFRDGRSQQHICIENNKQETLGV